MGFRATTEPRGKKAGKRRGYFQTQGSLIDMRVELNEMDATTRIEEAHDHQPSNDKIRQEDTCKERNNFPTIPMRTVTKSNDTEVKCTHELDHQR